AGPGHGADDPAGAAERLARRRAATAKRHAGGAAATAAERPARPAAERAPFRRAGVPDPAELRAPLGREEVVTVAAEAPLRMPGRTSRHGVCLRGGGGDRDDFVKIQRRRAPGGPDFRYHGGGLRVPLLPARVGGPLSAVLATGCCSLGEL